ncbi:MAG: carbohydrate ABC transporter permease [Massiliimalia sp.]|jgi:cellobiose transport system permease protein
MKKSKKINIYPYLFLAPFFIIFIAFSLFPMFYSLYISFMKWDGVNEMTFMGLGNYTRLFTDPEFYKSLWNTLLVIVLAIPLQMLFGLVMAVLLKDFFQRARTALQFINYTPNITTPVAVGLVFAILFDTRIGAVNQLIQSLGYTGDPIDWLGQAVTARIVVIILLVWKYFGYMMVMFLAGLSTIPDDLYEAATIDGANYFQTFCSITIPMLKPTFIFLTTTSVISGLQLFAEPQLLFSRTANSAGPGDSVLTSIMYMYDTAFQRFDFGYGAAIAYGLFLIILLLSITRIRKITGEEDS